MNRTQIIGSTLLKSVGFADGVLEVEFVKGGSVYQYQKVPKSIYESLLKADSKGKYFRANIYPVFDSEKVLETIRE
jgi:hypothetical protein